MISYASECHYYHAVGTIRPNHAGYLNKDGSQKNYDHSNLGGVNSNYQFPEHTTYDDFLNNAEYRDYNSCKPTYGGANHRKHDNHYHMIGLKALKMLLIF